VSATLISKNFFLIHHRALVTNQL